MKNCIKKAFPFFLALVVLVGSMSISLPALAGAEVSLELGGGTLQGAPVSLSQGDLLPNYEKVTKNGATFGGWYASADFSGKQVFSVPEDATGSLTYYARWIKHNVSVDDFDAYTDTASMNAKWNNWGDTSISDPVLNTDSAHAYSGNNSMKIPYAQTGSRGNMVYQKSIAVTGDGMAFWVEATNAMSITLRFNTVSAGEMQTRNIPAGKFLLTIPWSEIGSYVTENNYAFWAISIISKPTAVGDVVYVDSIGTYSDLKLIPITFNANGGTVKDQPAGLYKGDPLPNYETVTKDGATFAGWYTSADFSGTPVYSVPDNATGTLTYYARWIKHTASFDDFESYTDSTGWGAWTDEASVSLNTDAANAYDGSKSLKFDVAKKFTTNTYGTICQYKALTRAGDGISFWVSADKDVELCIALNKQANIYSVMVPAGKSFVTIPWDQYTNLPDGDAWNPMFFRIPTNVSTAYTLYIDSIGTYSDLPYTATLHYAAGTTEKLAADEDGLVDITGKVDTKAGELFLGWYTDTELTVPFDATAALTGSIDLYPKFAAVSETVTVDEADEFQADTRNFGILGAQIRPQDNSLRFIARISKALIEELSANGEIEYGIALTSENYFNVGGGGYNDGNPQEMLKGDGTSLKVNKLAVTNVAAVNLYNDFENYYRYTAVLTGLTDAIKDVRFCARAYITYVDANGNEQTYYATESDNDDGQIDGYRTGYGAYWKSYSQAYADYQQMIG